MKKVEFKINKESLEEWSVNKKYELFPLDLTVMLGTSSSDIIFKNLIKFE